MTLHEGLTKIKDWAFHDCLKLKKIRIPKSVTDIGELALGIRYNRGNGAEEVVPGGFTVEGYTGSAAERYVKNVHRFENIYYVFFTDVKTVKIGANIMIVGAKAFYGCSKLSNVTIFGTKLTTAKTGANAFKGIRSNCRFKVPASRVSAYKKLLRAKGAGPKIIVTK